MIYHQSTGQLFADDGTTLLGSGHAGNGAGLNNPTMQDVHNVGPLPCGRYSVGDFTTHVHLGPLSAPLTPLPDPWGAFTWLRGRGGFYIHGPEFSEGCIVMPEPVRAALAAGSDRTLVVIP
jgi:hypothetical protein